MPTVGTLPVAGHGSTLAVEVDPVGAPGSFTTIPQCTSSIDYATQRDKTEITPHAAGVDYHIVAQVIKRDDLTLDVSYMPGNAVHSALSGHYHANRIFGMMILGPEGTAPSVDCVIESGQLTTWKQMGPVRNGEYKMSGVFRASGPFKYNGTLYS